MQNFNKYEQEIIVLNAICDLIDQMVNYEMFAEQWSPDWSNILFRTSTHARLFNILLADFLSFPQSEKGGRLPFDLKSPPSDGHPSDRSYLFFVKEIVKDPQVSKSATDLDSVVDGFANWLDSDTIIKNVWFSSLDLEINITVNRAKVLKMTGNIGKHNFTRLSSVVKSVQKVLQDNGIKKNIDECYLALPEFQEWFHDHAFVYQSSQIAEFLIGLRYAIHHYLIPEFKRAYKKTNPDESSQTSGYSFDVPQNIKNTVARAMYWDLMNSVRQGPRIPKFTVDIMMKSALR